MNSFRFLFILSAIYLSACHSGLSLPGSDSTTVAKDALALALPPLADNLDWNNSADFSSSVVEANIMEGLTALDLSESQPRVLPDLAQGWEGSRDGLSYTFHLRENMKWSDGEPLVAAHFLASWKRLLLSDSPWAEGLFVIRGGRAFHEGKIKNFSEVGIKAVNDKTIQVNLSEPVDYFLALMAHHSTFPIRPDLLEKNKNVWPGPTQLVTIGPFSIDSVDDLKRVQLKRNEAYILKKPKIKDVALFFGLKPEEALERFKSGELNGVIDAPATLARIYSKHDEVFLTPLLDVTYLTFNVRQKPMSNPIFRRVVGMSLDREDLSHTATTGVSPLADIVPPGLIGYESNRGVRYDPDAAKTLREHSGYGDLKKYDPIYLKNSLPQEDAVLVSNIQTQLKRTLGIDIKLVTSDKDIPSQSRVIILAHWAASVPDPDNFLNLFLGSSVNNPTGWKNKNYDDFVRQAAVISSVEARAKLYAKAQHILTETEMPVIPLFLKNQYSFLSRHVRNLPLNALGLITFRNVIIE